MQLALPAPNAAKNAVRIARLPLFLRVPGKNFDAPRTLDLPAAAPIAKDKKQDNKKDAQQVDRGTAAATFAQAATESHSLFVRLMAAASQLSGEADRQQNELCNRQEADVQRVLAGLADDLAQRKLDAANQRDFALNHIHSRADLLRYKVTDQSNRALGRLAALRRTIAASVSALKTRCTGAQGELQQVVSSALTMGASALRELNRVKNAPTYELSQEDEFKGSTAVDGAELEAAEHYIGGYLDVDIREMTARRDAVQNFAEPLLACVPCEIDGKFRAIDGHIENLGVAGPRAVRRARDGAIKAIDNAAAQMELSVLDSYRQTETSLTERHDMMQSDIARQTAATAVSQRRDLEAGGTKQIEILTGMAAAQNAALNMVSAEVRKAAAGPPAQTNALAQRASLRLRTNVKGIAERHPASILSMAARAQTGRAAKSNDASRATGKMTEDLNNQQKDFVGETFHHIGLANDQSFFALDHLPADVGRSCDSMLKAARTAFDSEESGIGHLTNAVAGPGGFIERFQHAKTGLVPPPQESGNANPGAETHDTPPAPVCSMPGDEPNMSVMPSALTLSSPASTSSSSSSLVSRMPPATSSATTTATSPTASGTGRPTAPQTANCGNCETTRASVRTRTAAANGATSTPTTDGNTGEGGGGDDVGVSSNRTHERSPQDFKEHAAAIWVDPLSATNARALINQIPGKVGPELRTRAQKAKTALDEWGETNNADLMHNALRGLTPAQGAALNEVYASQNKGTTLETAIIKHSNDSVVTSDNQDSLNLNAMLNALRGKQGAAAIYNLYAASNAEEAERTLNTLRDLTENQRAAVAASGADFEALITHLNATQREEFRLLLAGDTVRARSSTLRRDLDGINDRFRHGYQAEERELALGGRFTTAERFDWALEGPSDRADIFGLEEPGARADREAAHKTAIQRDFATLDGVADAIAASSSDHAFSSADAPPGAAMIAYATRPLEAYRHYGRPAGGANATYDPANPNSYAAQQGMTVSDYRADERGHEYRSVISHISPYRRLWIENIVVYGSTSRQARAARTLSEFRRRNGARPDITALDEALHIGSADAVEGGNFQRRSTAEAERERMEIFALAEQYRRDLESSGSHGPVDPAEAQASFRSQLEAAYRDRPTDQRVALAIIDREEGDVQAVVDYAIEHENTALLTRYLGRMDSRQIEELVTSWNRDHPNGPGLYERLGMFNHHWSIGNMNGAVFTGDEANALELAFFGVPQNDKQRSELALRVMQQQIDQSGWLGRLMAGDEYDALVQNANNLRSTMGVTEAQVDELGRIRITDPQTGMPVRINFDADGRYRPAQGGDTTAFEGLLALSRITADNYTQAVDRMASIMTTIVMVIAAIAISVVTFGAGAAIMGPMLLAMGIAALGGGLTIAINASMRGGRYGRDDLTRDIVSMVIQIVTAGLNVGIARGIAQGGRLAANVAAGKVVASSLGAGSRALMGAAARPLMTNLLTGTALGALSGGATAAFDPAARRSENYGDQVMHGFFRGAVGGFVSAGVSHGINSGLTRAAQRLAISRAMQTALARGASREAATRFAAGAASRMANSRLMEIGARSFTGGAAGSLGRGAEMGYENIAAGKRHSAADFYREMRNSFIQSAIQNAGEGIGIRAARTRWTPAMRVHAENMEQQRPQMRAAAERAFDAEMARAGIVPHPPATGGAEPAPPPPPRAAPTVDEAQEGAPVPRATLANETDDPATSRAPKNRTASADEEIAVQVRTVDDDPAAPTRTMTGANDNGPAGAKPGAVRIALDPDNMVSMGRVRENSVFIHPDSKNLMAANDNFARLVNADPSREVAIYRNLDTGEYLVIQGGAKSVAMILPGGEISFGNMPKFGVGSAAEAGGAWVLHSHFHPNRVGQASTNLARRLPSGANGDFGVITNEARWYGGERRSRIYFVDNGKLTYTDFSVQIVGGQPRYSVTYPDPVTGIHGPPRTFDNIEAYHRFFSRETGIELDARTGAPLAVRSADRDVPALDPVRRAGGEEAALGQTLTDRNRADAAFVARRMGQAGDFEASRQAGTPHASGLDPVIGRSATLSDARDTVTRMGLVDRPDAMRRLHAVLNDPALSVEIKARLLEAVRDATRISMINRGELAANEQLLLTLHGAPKERAASMRDGGVDLRLVKDGERAEHDFGPGLYLTTEIQTALNYAGRKSDGGEIFPVLMRARDFGAVVDVSPGGPHRAAWDAFVRANLSSFGGAMDDPMAAMARGQAIFDASPEAGTRKPNMTELLNLGMAERVRNLSLPEFLPVTGRGTVFEAFLQSLGRSTGNPRLAQPDFIVGELGTGGAQQVIRSGRNADMMNEQLGVGRMRPQTADDDGNVRTMVRTVDDDGAVPSARRRFDPALAQEVKVLVDDGFDDAFGPIHRDTRRIGDLTDAERSAAAAAKAAFDNQMDMHIENLRKSNPQLDQLLTVAPEATHAILRAMMPGGSVGDGVSSPSPAFTQKQQDRFVAELAAAGISGWNAIPHLANLRAVADPEGSVYRSVAMMAEQLSRPLDVAVLTRLTSDALALELDTIGIKGFAGTTAKGSAGPQMKSLLKIDQDATITAVRTSGGLAAQEAVYGARRLAAGASAAEIVAELAMLRAVLTDPKLATRMTTARTEYENANIKSQSFADLVGDSPLLRLLANAHPEYFAERFAAHMIALSELKGPQLLTQGDFEARIVKNIDAIVKPTASETASVFRLAAEMTRLLDRPDGSAIDIIKANVLRGGVTNKGDIDIIAVLRRSADEPEGSMVRVLLIDDKAENPDSFQLNDVKAMVGTGLIRNLNRAISEIEQRNALWTARGIPADDAHVQAVAQMRNAVAELETLQKNKAIGVISPLDETGTERHRRADYAAGVAEIMERYRLTMLVSHEHGNITSVAPWLQRYGFMRVDDYVRLLEILRRLRFGSG